MLFESTIKLIFENSLIESNIPEKVTQEMVVNKIRKDLTVEGVEKFGLFDTATPNFSNYYPDVTAEDLTPKDNEFVYPIVRSLSKTTVHKNWNPVDFSMGDVLKNSMNLLIGMSVYPNHEAVVGNELGVTKDVFWDESYKKDNVTVPAGINSRLMIDGKSNPKIARNLSMNPPAIHSTSVTVRFLWEKSHPNMAEDDFFKNLSSYDKEGNQIRRIANKINAYPEQSFVSHGADPFAQMTDKHGKIINPKYASTVYNSMEAANHRKGQQYFIFNYKQDLIPNLDEIKNTIPDDSIISNSEITMNKTFLIALALVMGFKESDIPTDESKFEDFLTNKIKETKSTADKVAGLELEKTTLTAERDSFKNKYEAIKDVEGIKPAEITELKEFQNNTLTSIRNSVKENYNKLKGDKAVPAELANIDKANMESLSILGKEYEKQLNEKYPLSCADCKSTNVSRATAAATPEEKKIEPKATIENIVQNKIKATGSLSFFEAEETK